MQSYLIYILMVYQERNEKTNDKNLTNDNLKNYLDNIDDHMFTLNRLRYNTKENNFEVQKEVAMIHLITQDFRRKFRINKQERY